MYGTQMSDKTRLNMIPRLSMPSTIFRQRDKSSIVESERGLYVIGVCSSPEGADSEVRSAIMGIINGLGPPFAIHPWPTQKPFVKRHAPC